MTSIAPTCFWAVRGAGGNFGVVTAFELEAYEVDNVVYAQLVADATDAAHLLRRWGQLVEDAPRELTSFLSLFPGRRGNPPMAQVTLVYAGVDVEAAQSSPEPVPRGRADPGPTGAAGAVSGDVV